MVLVITSVACGIISACVALILQFKLTGWLFFAGLHSVDVAKRANIEIHRLRRRLSILLYFLAGGLIGGALLLYIKLMSESFGIPFFIALVWLVFSAMFFFYRKFDHNEYSTAAHRALRAFFIIINVFFALLCFLYIR